MGTSQRRHLARCWELLRGLSEPQRNADRMQEPLGSCGCLPDTPTRRAVYRSEEEADEGVDQVDLIGLLSRRGVRMDHLCTNLERNYGGRRREIDILVVNGAHLVAGPAKATPNQQGCEQ